MLDEDTATTPLDPRRTPQSHPGQGDTPPGSFALLREQVRRYGWRPAGSRALRRLAVRLRGLLPRGRFEAIPGHPRHVVGSIPGRGPAIVVGAHYDVEATPEGFVGANDGAAGMAAVVWVARALATARRSRPAASRSSPAACADPRPTPSATPAWCTASSCSTTSPRSAA
ncbi:MAG: M28 family peptidase [Actinomycetota bacterium]|nr:M28 family peptidase [Actinomycetota bacterium]